MNRPKISIAMCGRNDNHGGNFLDRLKLSLKSIKKALRDVDYQVILLDYNPVKGKPLLSQCFKGYSEIKHVVFSRKQHKQFISQHFEGGAVFKVKENFISKKEFYKNKIFKMFLPFAFNMAIKNCDGEYILSTTADNVFSLKFGNLIDRLEPNILYRSGMYRCRDYNAKKNRYFAFNNFDDLINDKYVGDMKYKLNATSGAGEFLLMDRNSWVDSGGYIPTLEPVCWPGDPIAVFMALSKNKKIRTTNFGSFNIRYLSHDSYEFDKINHHGNYIIEKNGIKFSTMKEWGINFVNRRGGDIRWKRFLNWSKTNSPFDREEDYSFNTEYEERLDEIKLLFKSILDDDFLLY
jgi:hypothetical protein